QVDAWPQAHPLIHGDRGYFAGWHGDMPVLRGTVLRVTVDHLPDGRAPHKTMWLWHAGPAPLSADELWRAYLARFYEHTFKFAKGTLGLTAAKVRTPDQADRWVRPAPIPRPGPPRICKHPPPPGQPPPMSRNPPGPAPDARKAPPAARHPATQSPRKPAISAKPTHRTASHRLKLKVSAGPASPATMCRPARAVGRTRPATRRRSPGRAGGEGLLTGKCRC